MTREQKAKESQWVQLLLFQCRALGLPAPTLEHRFHPVRRWRFDLAWFDQRVALEVDGGIWTGGRHVRPLGYRKDVEKLNHAVLAGWRVLRAVPEQVKSGEAVRMVESLLSSGSPTR
jgi:very-short-patch-repair endonuclease